MTGHEVLSASESPMTGLVGRGTTATEIFHFESGNQVPGPDPEGSDYRSSFSFRDPDGNGWLVQGVRGANR